MSTRKRISCLYCGERILAKAIKCRECHEWLNQSEQDLPVPQATFVTDENVPMQIMRGVLFCIPVILIVLATLGRGQ